MSRDNEKWEVRILQRESNDSGTSVGELTFSGEEPLTFEWEETRREAVWCGSASKLTIVSPGDRTYEGLYTVEPGAIKMQAWRNGRLYWEGLLDPEFYEEPYAYLKDYEVTLTFTDLGILDRFEYNLIGIQTAYDIVRNALDRAGLTLEIDQSMISTLNGNRPLRLEEVKVMSGNFCDEDGEWMSCKNAIAGIMQPLSLKLQQRGGTLWVYDLNGLYERADREAVRWASNDQRLSAATVANRVKVTLSVYGESTLLDGELKLVSSIDRTAVDFSGNRTGVSSYLPQAMEVLPENTPGNISFTMHYGDAVHLVGVSKIGPKCKAFHIQPFFGGQEMTGVAWYFRSGGWVHNALTDNKPGDKNWDLIMRSERVYVPENPHGERYLLRLDMEMLVDARYNPFEQPGDDLWGENYDKLDSWTSHLMVPAILNLCDADGNVLMHYDNTHAAKRLGTSGEGYDGLLNMAGKWNAGKSELQRMMDGQEHNPNYSMTDLCAFWLEWYDPERKYSGALGGWKKNRHNIGVPAAGVNEVIKNIASGEYIAYPPKGGYLEIHIVSGLWGYDGVTRFDHREFGKTPKWDKDDGYGRLEWVLYKAPRLCVVSADPPYGEVETNDVSYTGVIDERAKEGIDLDTICGTVPEGMPCSRAALMDATGRNLGPLTRAGRTAVMEQLLIGTVYSQYAKRRTRLSGSADCVKGAMTVLTEAMQPGKVFLVTSNIEDAKEGITELSMTELRPDEYTDN